MICLALALALALTRIHVDFQLLLCACNLGPSHSVRAEYKNWTNYIMTGFQSPSWLLGVCGATRGVQAWGPCEMRGANGFWTDPTGHLAARARAAMGRFCRLATGRRREFEHPKN